MNVRAVPKAVHHAALVVIALPTLVATVAARPGLTIGANGTVSASPRDVDILVKFRDGFDADGATHRPATLTADAIGAMTLSRTVSDDGRDTRWSAPWSPAGHVDLQQLDHGAAQWVRSVRLAPGQEAAGSRWAQLVTDAPIAVARADADDREWVLLQGTTRDLRLLLQDHAARRTQRSAAGRIRCRDGA